MFRKPLLQMSELYSTGLLQCAGGEPAHPVVMHAQRLGYLSMLSYAGLHVFSSLLNAFFYVHGVDIIVATVLL